jgi:hypothetical protein
MGQYLKGPAADLVRLFPRHDFARDARTFPNGDILIETLPGETPTEPVADTPEVTVLTHAEAVAAVNELRVPADDEGDGAP